jgi:hypothetical protein
VEDEIVLSPETEKLLTDRSNKGCQLCLWIVKTFLAEGHLKDVVNFPVKAQMGHIAYEKAGK